VQTRRISERVVGFIVLLSLGVAFTGFHDDDESQKAVSVFGKGSYDDLQQKMKDFAINST